MRRVVIYTRVSTDDQKENGYSLQDQEQRLRKECERKGYIIEAHYQDDHSAKNFNRPKFQQFLSDLKSRRIRPDLFLCVRMDRFSRNMMEGLMMIQELKKLKVEFQTLENNIDLDIPENLVMLAVNMAQPQAENERRGLNTMRGMRQAAREGRFTWKAPIGYLNNPINKGVLLIDEERAPLIRFAFETYATGIYSIDQVRLMLAEKGLKTVKQNLINILKQPLYIGKIKLKAYKDEPEELFQGLHEPIVTEDVFNACQDVFSGKGKKLSRLSTGNENLPLRGHLQCAKCGGKLTGSNSRSRNGSLHSYYHCQNDCKERFRADEANEVFIQFLQGFEISEEAQELYSRILADVFKASDADKIKERKKIEEEAELLQNRIDKLNIKYLDELIDDLTYRDMKRKLEAQKSELASKHMALEPEGAAFNNYMKFSAHCSQNLSKIFKRADLKSKQEIIGSIFPEKTGFFRKNISNHKN